MLREIKDFTSALSVMIATLPYEQQKHFNRKSIQGRKMLDNCIIEVDKVLEKEKSRLKKDGKWNCEFSSTESDNNDSVHGFRCSYCKKTQTHLIRHLESKHANEADVVAMMTASTPQEQKVKRKELLYRGNFLYGNSSKDQNSSRKHGTIPCYMCHKIVSEQSLARHFRTMHKETYQEETNVKFKDRVIIGRYEALSDVRDEKHRTILAHIKDKDIISVIRSDRLLHGYLRHLCMTEWKKLANIVFKTTTLAQFLLYCRQTSAITSLRDCCTKENYYELKANLSGFAERTSKAGQCQPLLVECATAAKIEGRVKGDDVTDLSQFLDLVGDDESFCKKCIYHLFLRTFSYFIFRYMF